MSAGSKIGRYVLLGLGSTAVLSSVVNLISTIVLIEPSDAESLGVSRNSILVTCVGFLICGLGLIWLALQKKK